MANLRLLLTILLGSAVLLKPTQGYRITVGAYESDCYFDRVSEGDKISMIYEVIDGGFLDIDLLVTKPNGEELLTRMGESSGKFTLTASESGNHTYCFSNQMSTVTPKEIQFSVDISKAEDKKITEFGEYTAKEIEEIQPEKLEVMIRELKGVIHGVAHEQEYIGLRYRIHRRIQEATNSRYTLWAFFETVLVTVVSVGQALYIKRFFEVRRMV